MAIKDMLGRSGVVTREEALKTLAERFTPLPPVLETIHISHSLARVAAEDILSPADLPEFTRSTMDGFAVRSGDTFGAAESRPALLSIVGDILMGTVPERVLAAGEAMKIATGGALPHGADAVVMFEQTQPAGEEGLEVVKAVAPLENVIQTGDDIKKGERIVRRGHRMRPQDMGALAGVGVTRMRVHGKPRVAIIMTGNELVPADDVPGPGQVRDINSFNLEGLIAQTGGNAIRKGILPDEYDRLREALEAAVGDSDLVLITGGSSVGLADCTAQAINAAGRPGVLVHGVSIKPGKPLIVGLVNAASKQVPVFGLPGHPAAVSICFELFVKPVLIKLTGETTPPELEGLDSFRIVRARLSRSISSSAGREDHVRVTLERKADGLWARPVFGPSGLISTLVKASGTVVVPVNVTGIEAGEDVRVRLF